MKAIPTYMLAPFICYKLIFVLIKSVKNAARIFNSKGDGTWTPQETFAFHANIPLNSSHAENV